MDIHETEERALKLVQVEKFDEAYDLLLPIEHTGSTYTLMTLGWLCEFGDERKVDLARAQRYYQQAASDGYLGAYLRLGSLLKKQGDFSEARSVFKLGAESESIGCMSELGSLLVDGNGGGVDVVGGMAWLNRAAAKGHIFARRKLLSIELDQSNFWGKKIFIWLKIVILGVYGTIFFLRDRNSDELAY